MSDREVEFRVTGTPATQGSKRAVVNRKTGQAYVVEETHERTKTWRSLVTDRAEEAMRGRLPLSGPLFLQADFRFNRPASHYGTGRNRDRLKDSAPRRPASLSRWDLEKLLRALEDAMTDAKVWFDDAQVVTVRAAKWYTDARSDPEGAWVAVTEI